MHCKHACSVSSALQRVHHNPNECTNTVADSHAYSVADGGSFVGPHVVTHDTAVCRTHIITHGNSLCCSHGPTDGDAHGIPHCHTHSLANIGTLCVSNNGTHISAFGTAYARAHLNAIRKSNSDAVSVPNRLTDTISIGSALG